MKGPPSRQIAFAYALAVAEENGSGGRVVTAPTCGSCAVVPATLRYLMETNPFITRDDIIDALATAGVIGNIMKTNASISGATVGCQVFFFFVDKSVGLRITKIILFGH